MLLTPSQIAAYKLVLSTRSKLPLVKALFGMIPTERICKKQQCSRFVRIASTTQNAPIYRDRSSTLSSLPERNCWRCRRQTLQVFQIGPDEAPSKAHPHTTDCFS